MSRADEYRQYAREAMGWVNDCTDPEERLVLISLASTWLKAAGRSPSSAAAGKLGPETDADSGRVDG
jgi:hypothetical protein